MSDENKTGNALEQELVKRLEQFDRRFDRNGWFFLVIVIVIFFITLYLFMQIFRVPEVDTYTSSNEILGQIESLEERIESYEIRIEELEAE
ncbi:MAG: hypothetical protein ACTHYF_03995 [Ruoffia tabacinasalis]|mgnify:FL=1|uniref:Uncharacterized protein n=2 Tax=Ruoffia TaxID=2862144 RepID=A0A839A3B9_9LACT|nr:MULTISPECIES: hypothetical protein [Ruoffia]HBY90397.1 hypothetical protein [Aerococcaceae bacterium]MBA5728288.1 hypothetical protein [Ruoffia halotolerans]MBG9979165.1 hypothetical protein [Ruoffia tabacinasalis]TLQ40305.1 hypothetical protein FEZ33_08445 [Ruoffia tabacinasalis]HJG47413.1 hypothetical protein [Ruoffia tabacinasalis]